MKADPAPPPLAVVNNGVDLDGLQPAALPREPTIAMVANLIDYKRHDRFLEAFQVVRDTIPSARAVLVGDGPERATASKPWLYSLGSTIVSPSRVSGPIRVMRLQTPEWLL